MNKVKIIFLTITTLIATSTGAHAETLLQPDDFIGFSFWLISLSCLAATAFFFLESGTVAREWKTPIIVSGLITGVTFVHTFYIGNVWITTQDLPINIKYIDWLITIPLLSIQFYFVISAVARKASPIIFWKFLIAALVMVWGSYAGETGHILPFLGFVIWMVAWIYILYEIFIGDAGTIISKSSNEDLVKTFGIMRMIKIL